MDHFIFFSYSASALAFGALLLFSFTRTQRNMSFRIATLLSIIWSLKIIQTTLDEQFFLADTLVYETLRNTSWILFLATLLSKQLSGNAFQYLKDCPLTPAFGGLVLFVVSIETFPAFLDWIRSWTHMDPRFFSHVVFAISGLILTEQLYRNTPLSERWNIKFACLALSAIFAIDFMVYSKSLLYKQLDVSLWQTRGLLNALTAPLLGIAITRTSPVEASDAKTKHTSPRKTTFYTTILLGCGIYLLLMSVAGYYLKHTDTVWGETLQTLFIFLALLLLVISFTSGKIRALAKVYFSKHFFHYSYDYREEWLKISKSLAKLESLEELKTFIITTLTNLVESCGGGLWLKNDQGEFVLAATQNFRIPSQELTHLKNNRHLPEYLANKQWVIDFFELAHTPEVYDDIDLSPWCYEDSQIWLIIPLFHLNHLEAFVALTQPRAPRKLNWEDHDLLKTVGMQLANAIALSKASEALANNRQFEAYHRLSAYLVHDLKNIAAQISLIVKNADKHKHNPEFFDDTLDTLHNVVNKMQRIVDQLKQGKPPTSPATLIDLGEFLRKIQKQHIGHPEVQLAIATEDCAIKADSIKLASIISNLIQNAQDATKQKPDGWVKLSLNIEGDYAALKIIDNGIGMDEKFIAERLFKPFDTTKGNAGMGIGAYEARDYILKNHGQLDVESQAGKGTTITLHLPLTKSGTE